jgi:hypothetical protein
MDWIVSALSLFSKYALGQKWAIGWGVSTGVQFLWIYRNYKKKDWGLMPLAIISLLVNLYNWYLWR